MLTELQTTLSALRFLFDIYKFRRDAAKDKPSPSPAETVPAKENAPNPERLKELIEELQQSSGATKEDLPLAIEKKFPPEQATQVKDDLAAVSLLANPPNFANYDYYALISQYLRALRTVAVRTELFRLRGWKNQAGLRLLQMPKTAAALLPRTVTIEAVYRFGEVAQASVTDVETILTDEQEEVPLLVALSAEFSYRSYGMGSQRREKGEEFYRFRVGQDRNWLQFGCMEEMKSSPGFKDFTYMLKASRVKEILDALKQDIACYLHEVEEEQPTVKQLAQEVRRVLNLQGSGEGGGGERQDSEGRQTPSAASKAHGR